MQQVVYHGSPNPLREPLLGKGDPSSEFGMGFYVCQDGDEASRFASRHPGGGYLNSYRLEEAGLKVLNLDCRDEEGLLRWLSLVMFHRYPKDRLYFLAKEVDDLMLRFLPNLDGYDAILGYRADGAFYDFLLGFLLNQLPLSGLRKALSEGLFRNQLVLRSEKAFAQLSFLSSERIGPSGDYLSLMEGVRGEYRCLRGQRGAGEAYFVEILRKSGGAK